MLLSARIARTLVGVLGLALAASAATAQTINIGTGTAANGAPLADGALDPRWQISIGGGPFTAAEVMFPSVMCCSMATVDMTVAKWITDQSQTNGSSATGWGVDVPVVFRRTFDLTGYDLSTVGLGGEWRIADHFDGGFLNGTQFLASIGSTNGNWASDHGFSLPTGSPLFMQGTNTLEFRARSVNSQWDGLYVSGAVTGRIANVSTVPEPATILLTATGLLAVGGVARRRRQRA